MQSATAAANPIGRRLPEGALILLGLLLIAFGRGAFSATTAGFTLAPKPAGAVRVVTWNVGGAERAGKWRSMDDDSLVTVKAALLELNPDLVLLQEISDRDQLDELTRALGEEWILASRLRSSGRRLAILARGGELDRFLLGGAAQSALAAHWISEDRRISVVNLHADAFSASTRNEELGQSVDGLLRVLPEEGAIGLLGGDFNLDLDLDKRGDLFSDDQQLDVESYNYATSRFEDLGLGRGNTAEPDRRIDYLLLHTTQSELGAAGPLKGRRTGQMDHDPLVVDLHLP